jgi:hypothetical protein
VGAFIAFCIVIAIPISLSYFKKRLDKKERYYEAERERAYRQEELEKEREKTKKSVPRIESMNNNTVQSFNVLDEATWNLATDNDFTWKDNTFHDKDDDKQISEKVIITLLSKVMGHIDTLFSLPTTRRYGRQNIITEFLDGLVAGMPNEVVLGKIVQKIPYGHRLFDIQDLESWGFASAKPLLWKDQPLYNPDGDPIIEKEIVQFFISIFLFLEEKEPLTSEHKIKAVNNILDRMAKYQSDPNGMEKAKSEFLEESNNDTAGEVSKFDPKNPETYQYAVNKQLIIDGIKIYDKNGEEKEYTTERSFADILSMMIDISKRKDPCFDVQNYINDYVQRKLDECTKVRMSKFTYGGYRFSEAQMEVAEGISEEKLTKIGEIMARGVVEHKPGSKIKQELFNSLGFDGWYLVNLRHADYGREKEVMRDYFLSFDPFETKEEVYEYFNKSKYLKKHPQTKKEIIDNALNNIEDDEGE